eukprot:3933896-Rhodomonas_salina.4
MPSVWTPGTDAASWARRGGGDQVCRVLQGAASTAVVHLDAALPAASRQQPDRMTPHAESHAKSQTG